MTGVDEAAGAFAAEVAGRVAAADLAARTARYALPARMSGTPELETVLARVAEDLRDLGLAVEETRVRALTSRPGRALVRLGGTIYPGRSAAFGGPAMDRRGAACPFAGGDAAGWPDRVVVMRGLPTPEIVALAEASSAQALVALLPDSVPHLVSVSPVWGSPTPWTVGNLPAMPVAVLSGEVARALGEYVDGAVASGQPPTLTVSAGVDTRWRDIPLLTADLPGGTSADFVLVGAHADAWFEGAMDNAAGVAALVETASALIAAGGPRGRGVRLAVWSGHEDAGRAGTQAYADRHWRALEREAAAYVQIAGPGGAGNHDLSALGAMPELAFLVNAAVAQVTGAPWRPLAPGSPGGDRSFAGIGLSSARLGGGAPPDDPTWPHGRAWHSPDDRLARLDVGLLARDASVSAHAVAQAAASLLEPVDLAAGARAVRTALAYWQARLIGRLDLAGAGRRAADLTEGADALERACAHVHGGRSAALNAAIRAAGRSIVRLESSSASRFEHDAALPLGPLPTLAVCEALLGTAPGSAPADLATVAAVRARTAVEVSLEEAGERIRDALALARAAARRRPG